jgi:hypothetical protein
VSELAQSLGQVIFTVDVLDQKFIGTDYGFRIGAPRCPE